MDAIAMMEFCKPDELYMRNFNDDLTHRIFTGHVSPQHQKKQLRNYTLITEQEFLNS